MDKLICIVGPTAVGKTKVSINLAKHLNTEIVSGDSMLIYRGLDIGTAKPTLAERQGITHHFIDILHANDEYNAVEFQQQAAQKIAEINFHGKIPILAGGTGLYVKALVEGYIFSSAPENPELREELSHLAEKYGNEYLHSMLAQMLPETAKNLHTNDIRRIIRAIEVYSLSGKTVSQTRSIDSDHQVMYDALVIGLTMERSTLYERINKRVDLMIENGLVKEVESLLSSGVNPNSQSMKGIGYKEIISYLHGEVSFDYAVDKIKQGTRHFAKRQLTWYRKMPYIKWYEVDKINESNLMENIYTDVAEKFFSR